MAVIESPALLTSKDKNGEKLLVYPITRADCVDGLEELVDEKIGAIEIPEDSGEGLNIIPKQKVSFGPEYDSRYISQTGIAFVAGETYRVVFNGTSYDCVASGNQVGNASYFGGTDTGEPFFIVGTTYNDTLGVIISPDITQIDSVDIYHGEELILSTSFDDWIQDDDNNNIWIYSQFIKYTVPADETVIVSWDGVDYECTLFEDGGYYLGNLSIKTTYGSDTGEPFLFEFELADDKYHCLSIRTFDTSNSHAVRIYKMPEGVSSWNDLTDKPFYEEIGTVFEGTFQDDVDVIQITDTSEATLIVGQTYTYTWNGVEYTSECFTWHGLPAIGNPVSEGGEDNGQPVLIARAPVSWIAERQGDTTTDSSTEWSCKIVGLMVKQLDEKHLAMLNSSDTEVNVFAKTSLDFALETESSETYTAQMSPPTFELVTGETYFVEWDGTVYECVCKALLEGRIWFIGNSKLTSDSYEDTGEPFLISYSWINSVASNQFNRFATLDTSASHTVRIYQVREFYKLKQEYLPDGTATEEFVKSQPDPFGAIINIVPEQALTFSAEETFAGRVFACLEPSSNQLEIGKTYKVSWDGVEYTLVAKNANDINAAFAEYGYIGNSRMIGIGLDSDIGVDTGEPFFIGINNGELMILTSDTTNTTHTVRVWEEGTIDEKWLPDTVATKDYVTEQIAAIEIPEGGSGGGVSSWNDLTDKPFGEEVGTVFEGEFQDTLTDSDGDGVNDAWASEMMIADTSAANIEVGKTYTVIWDGVEYSCVALDFYGIPVLGNALAFGGADTGEPFAIARDATGAMMGTAGWLAALVNPPTDLTVSGLYTCKIEGDIVQPLDSKYLADIDYETQIINKPFGVTPSGTAVVDASMTFEIDSFFENYNEYIAYGFDTNTAAIIPGAEYNVTIDGNSYAGVGYSEEGEVGVRWEMIGGHTSRAVASSAISVIFLAAESLTTDSAVNVSIVLASDFVKKLDEMYLPDAAQPVSIDLSGLDTNGTIVETYADGTSKTTTMEFDENGNPIKITDADGNVTTLTW